MTSNSNRILLVDDEQDVLDGLCRRYRKYFDLVPACGPGAGLRTIIDEGPFAVVVSDYQMPGMKGAQFLAKAREIAPDMIRIMLTGQADMQGAIDAVNRGQLFRFLTKPCDPVVLRGCLDAALEQHRLQRAERDLLEQTVRGSIEVLSDVLALSNPSAFGRANRILGLVRHIVQHLGLADAWQFESAALLSQIGYITIPDDLLERVASGEKLPPEQLAMFDQHPKVARDLLAKIPRLQGVAEMVYHQQSTGKPPKDQTVALGGRMLAAALDFDQYLSVGANEAQALAALKKVEGKYDESVLEALANVKVRNRSEVVQVVLVGALRVGMVIRDDVRNTDGNLLVSAEHEITEGSLHRLLNYAALGRLSEAEFHIHMPSSDSDVAGFSAA